MRGFFGKSKAWQKPFEDGMRYGSAADFPRAEASFRQAVQLAPKEPYPHYELGYTLALLGRHDEALEEFRRTQELSPAFMLVETEIWISERFLSGAIAEHVVAMLRELQWIVDDGGAASEEAVALATQVVEAAPGCALGHFHLGKALLGHDVAAAEAALRRCLDLRPDDTTAIDAKWHVGALRRAAGDEDQAQKIWETIRSDYRGHSLTELPWIRSP